MQNKISKAFESIKAEEDIKENTIKHIYRKKKKSKRYTWVTVATCMLLFVGAGGFSYQLYAMPTSYIDIDINPSLELSVNRFGKVVRVHGYNEDGERVLSDLKLKNRSYEDAVTLVLEAIEGEGYTNERNLLSVSVQSQNDSMRQNVQGHVDDTINSHHLDIESDILEVDRATKEDSQELDLSPAKYLAIQELQEVDPTATVEECRHHTITELKDYTQQHKSNHYESSGNITNEDAQHQDNDDHQDGHH